MMKKVVVMLLCVAPLMATSTRLATLGGTDATTGISDFVLDEYNVGAYPSTITAFPNIISLELGSYYNLESHFAYAASFWEWPFGFLGVYLNHIGYNLPDIGVGGYGLIYGKQFCNFSAALAFDYKFIDSSGSYPERSYLSIGPGFTYPYGDANFVDFAFKYMMMSEGDSSLSDMQVRTRWWHAIMEDVMSVLAFGYYKNHLYNSMYDTHYDDCVNVMNFKWGLNISPFEEYLIILGLNYWNFSYDDTLCCDETYLDLHTGIEAPVRDWLVLRAGVMASVYEKIDEFTSSGSGGMCVYLGCGVHLGDFRFDGHISPDLFYTAPYFITGRSGYYDYYETGMALLRLSILYNFDLFMR
jgi:hypothetical protein